MLTNLEPLIYKIGNYKGVGGAIDFDEECQLTRAILDS